MAYFADLSMYQYLSNPDFFRTDESGFREVELTYPRVNVGWLEAGRPFATGPAPDGVLDALLDVIAEQNVNQTRGFQTCEFCSRQPVGSAEVEHRGRTLSQGSSEIRVPTAEGVMFAAPTLIGHYVAEHDYLPPAPFLTALLAFRRDHADDLATGWIPGGSSL